MANKQYNLYLDLSGSGMVPHIEIRRNDYDSNSFIVQVTQGGAPLDFTGMAPIFECLTPDGHYIRDDGSQYGTFSNVNAAQGTFEYTLVNEVFAVLGQIDVAYFAFEQAVTGAENPVKRLSTGNFTFAVIADAMEGNVAQSNYMSDVNTMLADINQLKADYTTLNPANYATAAQVTETANPAHNASGIIFGQEYLSAFHKKLMAWNFGANFKLIFSGDSTTAGDSTSSATFHIDQLIQSFARRNGFPMINGINAGYSGKDTEHWNTTYVAQDLANSPDLYIVRWGVNDPSYAHADNSLLPDQSTDNPTVDALRRTPEDFNTSLRAGLQQIRSQKDYTQLSIILMAPSATYDIPNGRYSVWYEKIIPYIKQAARDFQCCFINTYQYLYDAQNAADNMDNPYGDGRHIHPNDVRNLWIAGLLEKVIFPTGLNQISFNNFINDFSNNGILTGIELPSTFPYGISMNRVNGSGVVYNGGLITFKSTDNVVYQLNIGYSINNQIAERMRANGDAWSSWSTDPPALSRPVFQNGWVDGPSQAEYYFNPSMRRVYLQGSVQGGTTAINTVLFNLPYHPVLNRYYACVSDTGFANVEVDINGAVRIISGGNGYLYLDTINFLVA